MTKMRKSMAALVFGGSALAGIVTGGALVQNNNIGAVSNAWRRVSQNPPHP